MGWGLSELREYRGDLHIHTCLSPCADLEMSPRNVVRKAKKKGLDFIGICDHNSADNVGAAKRAGRKEGLSVIGGMEVTSSEEVHVLALFDSMGSLRSLQRLVYRNLGDTREERLYCDQVVANEEDEVIRFNRKLLIGASDLSIQAVVDLVHRLHGVAIASHVDRQGFGIIGQLGFVPDDLPLDALEIMNPSGIAALPVKKKLPVLLSSDAHSPDDIGRSHTTFLLGEISVEELRKSFGGVDGRRVVG